MKKKNETWSNEILTMLKERNSLTYGIVLIGVYISGILNGLENTRPFGFLIYFPIAFYFGWLWYREEKMKR